MLYYVLIPRDTVHPTVNALYDLQMLQLTPGGLRLDPPKDCKDPESWVLNAERVLKIYGIVEVTARRCVIS